MFAFGGEMFGKAGIYVSDKLCALLLDLRILAFNQHLFELLHVVQLSWLITYPILLFPIVISFNLLTKKLINLVEQFFDTLKLEILGPYRHQDLVHQLFTVFNTAKVDQFLENLRVVERFFKSSLIDRHIC